MTDLRDGRRMMRRAPEPLTAIVLLLILWNAVVLWLAYRGALDHSSGNDAAGAGMARGFRELFSMAAAAGIGLLALICLVVRQRTARIVFVALLALASLMTPMLL